MLLLTSTIVVGVVTLCPSKYSTNVAFRWVDVDNAASGDMYIYFLYAMPGSVKYEWMIHWIRGIHDNLVEYFMLVDSHFIAIFLYTSCYWVGHFFFVYIELSNQWNVIALKDWKKERIIRRSIESLINSPMNIFGCCCCLRLNDIYTQINIGIFVYVISGEFTRNSLIRVKSDHWRDIVKKWTEKKYQKDCWNWRKKNGSIS